MRTKLILGVFLLTFFSLIANEYKLGCLTVDPRTIPWMKEASIDVTRQRPDSLDYSHGMPPVGWQYMGSCTAWATGYYYKGYQEYVDHDGWDMTNPEHQFHPKYIYNQINGGRDGGSYVSDAFKCLCDLGVAPQSSISYADEDSVTWPTQKAYNDAYKPFIDMLYQHPKIKWSLHCSGILWDYFQSKHPEYILKVSDMVNKGQLELLTGGYYEPILPSIPDHDKLGQLNKMTEYIKTEFKYPVRGMWLAERVWEGHLPKILRTANIEYTVVDDYHFIAAGLTEKDLTGYYLTEEQGNVLKIFSISQKLRYCIPFKPPEETIAFFSQLASTFRHFKTLPPSW